MFHDQPDIRTVKVFKNGRSRAVRIPREFDFGGDEMIMRQQSDGTITLEPVARRRTPKELMEWLRAQPRLTKEDFPNLDDGDMLPIDDVELMTFYMLDTNILTAMARDRDGPAVERFEELGSEDVAISIVVASEVRFGAERNRSARSVPIMLGLVDSIRVLPFEAPADVLYGRLRADLEREGHGLTPNDYLIAAHAMALDAVLVTGDQAILRAPVAALKVENWLRA